MNDKLFEQILKKLKILAYTKVNTINSSSSIYETHGLRKTIIKMTIKNPMTRGLVSEYEILKRLEKIKGFPKPVAFGVLANLNVEYLITEYIYGATLTAGNYFNEVDQLLLNRIEVLFNNNIIHGDIKPENIIVDGNELYLIDFDQAYWQDNENINFAESPDIIGNVYNEELQMNYSKLIERLESWKK